jgi:hypothetical protein
LFVCLFVVFWWFGDLWSGCSHFIFRIHHRNTFECSLFVLHNTSLHHESFTLGWCWNRFQSTKQNKNKLI